MLYFLKQITKSGQQSLTTKYFCWKLLLPLSSPALKPSVVIQASILCLPACWNVRVFVKVISLLGGSLGILSEPEEKSIGILVPFVLAPFSLTLHIPPFNEDSLDGIRTPIFFTVRLILTEPLFTTGYFGEIVIFVTLRSTGPAKIKGGKNKE